MNHRRLAGAFGLVAAPLLSVAHAQGADQAKKETPNENAAALFALGMRLGKGRSLLTERTGLTAAFLRAGLRSTPPLTRVEMSDGELDRIATYLSRTDSQTESRMAKGQAP